MINCLIIDDEPLARQMIAEHLAHFPDWVVVKECINATEAWQALHESTVHVLFLDIQMPGISGIDFLRSLKNPPLVVFTTAYANYAVEGFELMAVDYLLKPITPGRFKQAIIRVQEKLSLPVLTIKEKPAELQPGLLSSNHIFVKVDSRLIRINFDDILFAEAQRDFTKIYFHEKNILISFHLKMLEEMLPQNKFIRIHRSYVINMSKVAGIEGNRVFIHQQEIPVGSNYKEHFLKSMGI